MKLVDTAVDAVGKARLYWKTPPLGKYMTYKEIVSYAVGGIGWYLIITVVQAASLTVGNFLIGNVIGIKPTDLYFLYLIATITSIPATALRASIIDNTRNRKGKYRPYLITMGLPTCILAIAFVWAPYEKMPYWADCLVVLAINIGFQFIYMFFFEAYENLIYVLSPNTQERTNVAAVKAVVYSIAPSIMNIVMPLASKWISNGNMADLRLYRYVYPPMVIIGMFICLIAYANTQEKIIQAKTHHVHMKFMDTLRAVVKNKYFWIISIAGWLGFLEASYSNILLWTYNYRRPCGEGTYALIVTLYGNASLWGMLFAPAAIKRFGKKAVLVFTNIMNIVFIALMYPVIVGNPKGMIWLLLCCLWMNALVGSFSHVLNPSIQGDIRDYQQYVTGERIDGMFSAVGLIGMIFTTAMSGVLPAAYKRGGINEEHFHALEGELAAKASSLGAKIYAENGDPDLYSVLYDEATFNRIIILLIGLSVIGAVMNVLPYFFYDLTETKQRGIVKVLKVRAMFEDFGNNALSDKELVEAIDLIGKSEEYASMEPIDLIKSKENIAIAKKISREAGKAAKKQYKADKETNIEIENSKMVMEELSKFSTNEFKEKAMIAKSVFEGGLEGLRECDASVLADAKAMSKATKDEKRYRSESVSSAKDRLRSVKLLDKYYPDKIEEFDFSIFETLFDREDEILEKLDELYKEKHSAKDEKNSANVKKLENEIEQLKPQLKEVRAEIKKATDESSIYARCAKPYNDAKKLLAQQKNYGRYEEIVAMYDDAKIRAEQQAAEEAAENARLEAEEKAYAEKLKAEKAAKKAAKKNK